MEKALEEFQQEILKEFSKLPNPEGIPSSILTGTFEEIYEGTPAKISKRIPAKMFA